MTGLDSLSQLQVLSLGHNLLADLRGTVLYLRQMSNLQSLCLRGNIFSPFSSQSCDDADKKLKEYQKFSIAFLPSAVYLDFQMITLEDVSNNYSILGHFSITCMSRIRSAVPYNRNQ